MPACNLRVGPNAVERLLPDGKFGNMEVNPLFVSAGALPCKVGLVPIP
jgi:hypothetical protein